MTPGAGLAKQGGVKRTVLVILSDRLAPLSKPRFFEIECQPDGTVLSERRLRRAPAKAIYDEVWKNEEGKTSLDSCRSMKRHYKHPLLKQTGA